MLPEVKTFLIAMSPLLELRGAIPLALDVYRLPIWSAFLFSFLGNLSVVLAILLLLGPVSRYLSRRFSCCQKFFTYLFARTRKRHKKKFIRWEEFALIVLVAIPLPLTGGWTGSLCAFLFDIPFRRSFPLIALGLFIAGLTVLLATLGLANFF